MNAPATTETVARPVQISAADFDLLPLDTIALSQSALQVLRRSHMTKESLAELAADIKARGITTPVMVRKGSGAIGAKYEMIAGERRYQAAKLAGITHLPAFIRVATDIEAVELQFSENIQRESLHELEEAAGYQLLLKYHKCDAKDLVAKVGKNEAHIHARLKLLDLCPEVQGEFYSGKVNASVALLIARIRDPKQQQAAMKGCLTGNNLGKYVIHHEGGLTFAEAKSYIHEEFIVYQDGAAAIVEAKKKGLPAKGISETKDLWKRHWAPPAGHILVEDVKEKLGAQPVGAVLMQNPHNGEAKLVLRKEKAVALFKEKKLALPSGLKPRPNYMGSSSSAAPGKVDAAAAAKAQAKAAREEREVELKIKIQVATFKAVRAKTPAKLGKIEMIEILELIDNDIGGPDCAGEVAPRPKSFEKCQERDLIRFLLDHIYAQGVDETYYKMKPLLAAAKRYGVDAAAIAKDLTEEFEEEEAKLAKAAPAGAGTWPPQGMKIAGDGANFKTPMTPSPALAAIVGTKPLTRVDTTKKVWAHIKREKLQDKKNPRLINADQKLSAVFGGKNQVSMFDMTKLLNNNLAVKK